MRKAIRVEGLTKLYRRMGPGYHLRTLKSALLDRSLTAGLEPEETIGALRDVSFAVERGEAFGVVGSNGSGKSTLLKVLAGILQPSAGSVEVDGRVAALIELGAGFHPEISGRENVFINGAVLGLSRREIEGRFDRIVEFSGLGDFIDEPVKNYSSGMYVRLGFSVAIHTDPDVLLVDEVLAVGDEAFSHRCLRRIEEFLSSGRTLLLVSHSLGLIEQFCDRALWLDGGAVRLLGRPRRVTDAYRQDVAEAEGEIHRAAKEERQREMEEESPPPPTEEPDVTEDDEAEIEGGRAAEAKEREPRRWGSREAEIVSVRLLDGAGTERYHHESGDPVTFELVVRAASRISDVVFGVGVFTPRGVECWGTNTHLAGFTSESLLGEATVRVTCLSLRLAAGEYLLDVAVHAREGYPYDYHRRILAFSVTSADAGVGIYLPEHSWDFSGGVRWAEEPGRSPAGRHDGSGPR